MVRGFLAKVESTPHSLIPCLNFYIGLESDENVMVLEVGGEVRIRKNGAYLILGSLNPLITKTHLMTGRRINFNVSFPLDYRRLEVIEEQRKGGDVWLVIDCHVLYLRMKPVRVLHEAFRHERVQIAQPATGGNNLKVPQSEWLKMLQEMGYERFRILEIPIPEPPTGTVIKAALRHIEAARKSFDEGDYDDVLVDCRKALEVIKKAISKNEIKLDAVLDSSESKTEKVKRLQAGLRDFLSLGPHELGAKIDRRDAEMALHFTISYVRYLTKKLTKKPT